MSCNFGASYNIPSSFDDPALERDLFQSVVDEIPYIDGRCSSDVNYAVSSVKQVSVCQGNFYHGGSFIEINNSMKFPPTSNNHNYDNTFNLPCMYLTGHSPQRNQPSRMLPKYKPREERLRRSVLMKNIRKRPREETPDKKLPKQQLNHLRCYNNDNYLNLNNGFMNSESKDEPQPSSPEEAKLHTNAFIPQYGFDAKLREEINKANAKYMEIRDNLVEEGLNGLNNSLNNSGNSTAVINNDRFSSWKRSFEDMQDYGDILSQFYMQPTQMLPCLDGDEEVELALQLN